MGRSVLVYSQGFNVNGSRPVSLWFHFQQLILVEMDQDKVASRVARPGQPPGSQEVFHIWCSRFVAAYTGPHNMPCYTFLQIYLYFSQKKFSLFQENIRFVIELSQYQVLSCLLGWYQDMVPARYRDEQAQTFSSRTEYLKKVLKVVFSIIYQFIKNTSIETNQT